MRVDNGPLRPSCARAQIRASPSAREGKSDSDRARLLVISPSTAHPLRSFSLLSVPTVAPPPPPPSRPESMAGSPNSNLSSPPSSTDGGGGADDAPSPSSSNVSSSVATPTRVLRDKRKRGANSDLLARVLTPSTPVTASSAAGSPRASPYGSRTRLPRKSSSQAAIMNAAVAAALNEPLSPGRGEGSPSGGREGTTRSRARDEPVIPTWLVHHADVDKGREAVRALEGLYPKPDPLSNDGWMTGLWKRDTADWMLEVLESTVDSTYVGRPSCFLSRSSSCHILTASSRPQQRPRGWRRSRQPPDPPGR